MIVHYGSSCPERPTEHSQKNIFIGKRIYTYFSYLFLILTKQVTVCSAYYKKRIYFILNTLYNSTKIIHTWNIFCVFFRDKKVVLQIFLWSLERPYLLIFNPRNFLDLYSYIHIVIVMTSLEERSWDPEGHPGDGDGRQEVQDRHQEGGQLGDDIHAVRDRHHRVPREQPRPRRARACTPSTSWCTEKTPRVIDYIQKENYDKTPNDLVLECVIKYIPSTYNTICS